MSETQCFVKKIEIKVFIAAQFELGGLDSDEIGEFQLWHNAYFKDAPYYDVRGAEEPLWVNEDGIAGTILGMGKVRSSSSMTALLLDSRFDFSHTYFLISGCAGTSPERATVGSVYWADYVVDYDLGLRISPLDLQKNEASFSLLAGFEEPRVFQLDAQLVAIAYEYTKNVSLEDSEENKVYRASYMQQAARRKPTVGVGTHLTGDSFFHGPSLSHEAQIVAELNGAGAYVISEMEGAAVLYVLSKFGYLNRSLCLRTPVNFDQSAEAGDNFRHGLANDGGEFTGGFMTGIENLFRVGSRFIDYLSKK